MTVRELNEKIRDIEQAIDDVHRYFPKEKGGYYYEAPEPMAVQLLREYAEMLCDLEVKVGGNV